MSEDQLVGMFKGFLLGIINNISSKDLIEMIKTNEIPMIFDFDLPPYLAGIKQIIANNKNKILPYITYENILKYGGEFRADLLAIISHPKGKKWMNGFLNVIRFTIKNIELEPEEIREKFYKRLQEIRQGKEDKEREKIEAEVNKILESNPEETKVEFSLPQKPENLEEKEITKKQKKITGLSSDFISDM